jgi:hypothetical protein
MGWAYAGETGALAGFAWAVLVNMQLARPWFRKPWLHVGGMVVGSMAFKYAADYEDKVLQRVIAQYERKGFVIPEDRKELFAPQKYT